MDAKNILAINFGGIGDEIFFLPTLISLKKEFPNSKITLALEPRSKGIKDLTDVIDDLILVDVKGKYKYWELFKLVIKAWMGKFDIVISSGSNQFISILLFKMGIKKRYGYNSGRLSEILLTRAVPLNKNQYACDMYHDLISPLTEIKTRLPQINVGEVDKIENSVLIHPGVSKLSVEMGMIKTIPAQKWAQVIELLIASGKKVILAGGPDDKECIETILNAVPDVELAKTKNLMDLAKLIASAQKFVCSDSAPLHIGVALGVKTYVIFGPTDDNVLIPKSPNVVAIKANDTCPLKPCLWARRQTTCEELSCLDISPKFIVDKILL